MAVRVVQGAYQTLPWIGGSFLVNKHLPAKLQSYSIHLVKIAHLLPYPVFKFAFGIGIVNQINELKYYSRKLVESSKWSDRLLFLLLTYSTIECVYEYFKAMVPRDINEKPENTNEYQASRFTLGLIGISLAIQLRYAPLYTLVGIAIGAILRDYRHALTFDNILKKMPRQRRKFLDENTKESYEKVFQTFIKGDAVFSNPRTIAEKCHQVWLTWSFMARAVSSIDEAFLSGMHQGQILSAYFKP